MAHNVVPHAFQLGHSLRRTDSPLAQPASSVSTSPRPPTSLSRPHWPWTPHTQSSSSSISISRGGPQHNVNWEATSSTSTSWTNTARNSVTTVNHMQGEDGIRQWNFTAFEWTVRNVHALRDWVEHSPRVLNTEDVEEPHEVLRKSPVIGDGKFKLEIVCTSTSEIAHDLDHANATPTLTSPSSEVQDSEGTQQPNQSINTPTLSICVTSLMVDIQAYDATIMAAVKVQDDRGGERGGRADWVWEYWESDWSFRRDSEVWECTMPTLSRLLQNQRIDETDSFVIFVQIHNPMGPQYPQHPSAYYVPRDLLDGVESSLDNPNTGDVRFICLEKQPQFSSTPPSPLVPTSPNSRRSTSETSGFSFSTQPKARKRYIYAHSDILIRRSEYFHTMLTSSFAENPSTASGERKIHEIVVEEADFVTIYWLLKYCYANWVLFRDQDDPRASVDRVTSPGWSTRWLSQWSDSEWDWNSLYKPSADDASVSVGSREDDTNEKSVLSGGSSTVEQHTQHSIAERKRPLRSPSGGAPATTSSLLPAPGHSLGPVPSSSARTASRLTAMTPNTISTPRITNSSSSKSSPRSPAPTTRQPSSTASSSRAPTSYAYPISPRQTRRTRMADPHPHPTPQPPPASALSIWSIAHRYSMPGLMTLALTHMMDTIQPSTAFPLLLASSRWDDLHALVQDYIVDQWDTVCESEEFDRCCQEMAAGEWGPEGGRTFAALFRRLRSR